MVMNIDHYAYASNLSKNDPIEKMIFALTTLGVCIWANSIAIAVIILFIMAGITVCKGGIPWRIFLKLMLVPAVFLILGVLTIAIGISENPGNMIYPVYIFGAYIGLTKAGILTASIVFFKALGAVSCLYFLSLNTPMVHLISALRKMKCPKLVVELMNLIYRFLFVLLETAETMVTAQNSRLGYARLSSGFRSLGMLASTVFIRAYKRSDEIYTALESRGYDGELNVLEETFETNKIQYAMPIFLNIVLIWITLFLRHTGGLV